MSNDDFFRRFTRADWAKKRKMYKKEIAKLWIATFEGRSHTSVYKRRIEWMQMHYPNYKSWLGKDE